MKTLLFVIWLALSVQAGTCTSMCIMTDVDTGQCLMWSTDCQRVVTHDDVMKTCDAKGLVYDYEGSDEQCS